jgi:hypothetical protein
MEKNVGKKRCPTKAGKCMAAVAAGIKQYSRQAQSSRGGWGTASHSHMA